MSHVQIVSIIIVKDLVLTITVKPVQTMVSVYLPERLTGDVGKGDANTLNHGDKQRSKTL